MRRIVFSIIFLVAMLGFAFPVWAGNEMLRAEPAMRRPRSAGTLSRAAC